MAPQFIYVMKDLRKVVPPSREILRGIWLSFYPGAKIGVLGGNGAGKSTLLKIMAGVDQDFQGEAWPHQGTKIGYLSQVPELDPTKNVRKTSKMPSASNERLLKQFEDISMKFAEPMTDDADGEAAGEAGKSAGADRRPQSRGSSTGRLKLRWTRCVCRQPMRR